MNREEFNKAFFEFCRQVIEYGKKSRNRGLLALEEDLYLENEQYLQRDIFWYGMRFVIDGTDREIIEKILSNIINQEEGGYQKTLMKIKKEAIISIREEDNPRIMMEKVNSYTDLSWDDPIMQELCKE